MHGGQLRKTVALKSKMRAVSLGHAVLGFSRASYRVSARILAVRPSSTLPCNTMSSASVEPVKVAILDDYQRVAHTLADWSPLQGRVKTDVFIETLAEEDALVERLKPYTIICAMRERTKFPASLLDRLPNLKLIATTGMRNAGIDVAHAKSKGIVVSGTGSGGNSTLEHIWALILATARHVALEDAGIKAKRQLWQSTIPVALAGKTLGLVGVGSLGAATAKVSLVL